MVEYLAKITAKGQMTLPIGVRRVLGVEPGDHVRLEPTGDGGFVMKPAARASDLAGLISYHGPARSVEEIRTTSRATFGK
jgi:AbrB family looped-hinge helix DNA binding protein